jgi:type IV secretion system protein VirD4
MSSISKFFSTNVFHDQQMSIVTNDDGIYLGRAINHDAMSGSERSTLVLGPSRSGKTSSIVVPNLLVTTRSCVITSTKNDVVAMMARARRNGATLLFDPSGTVPTPPGVHRIGYSPIRQSLEWDGAVLAARSLIDVARRGRGDRGDDHWTERASALVAPLLHGAAIRNESIGQLASRIDERKCDDILHEPPKSANVRASGLPRLDCSPAYAPTLRAPRRERLRST